jgi:hypothetical protein
MRRTHAQPHAQAARPFPVVSTIIIACGLLPPAALWAIYQAPALPGVALLVAVIGALGSRERQAVGFAVASYVAAVGIAFAGGLGYLTPAAPDARTAPTAEAGGLSAADVAATATAWALSSGGGGAGQAAPTPAQPAPTLAPAGKVDAAPPGTAIPAPVPAPDFGGKVDAAPPEEVIVQVAPVPDFGSKALVPAEPPAFGGRSDAQPAGTAQPDFGGKAVTP